MALAVRAREYEERQQREEEEELHRRVDAQYTRPPVRVYGRERRKHGISVSYRRFPALAQLNDEELAAVTLVPESSMAATASSMQSEGRCVRQHLFEYRVRRRWLSASALSSRGLTPLQ